jgi:hypothetical protein
MTEHQKQLLEEAARHIIQNAKDNCAQTIGFQNEIITAEEVDAIAEDTATGMAEEILSNPGKYGLVDQLKQVQAKQLSKDNFRLIQENAEYRKALELIALPKEDRGDAQLIAKEALKQEELK